MTAHETGSRERWLAAPGVSAFALENGNVSLVRPAPVTSARSPYYMHPMTNERALELLGRLVGTWTTEATHPAAPGVVVHGIVEITWLEGERFLIHRGRTDNPDFPDSISIIGYMDHDRADDSLATGSRESRLSMHYFDSRGVFRIYEASIDEATWRWWRNAPGFSQRFTGTFADGGKTIVGRSELRQDDVNWKKDLQITYRRSQ